MSLMLVIPVYSFQLCFLSPFLKTAAMFAESQSCGKIPVWTECLKMMVRIGAIFFAQFFKTWEGILSGPVALDELRFFSSFSIPFTSILRGSTVGKGVPWILAGGESLSFVKTEQNCFRSTLAFPALLLSR